MKEAIGSSWIFVICLTFIILFTGYIAISVNYNKAFQIKNYVIGKIEESPDGWTGELEEEIETYLTAQGYTTYGECKERIVETTLENGNPVRTEWKQAGCVRPKPNSEECGVCIYKQDISPNTALDDFNKNKAYYRVVSYFEFDLPIVNVFLNFKISGTSKYVVTDK